MSDAAAVLEGYFGAATSVFQRVAQQHGAVSQAYAIAGQPLFVHAAGGAAPGGAAPQLFAALSHLRCALPAGAQPLVAHAWDARDSAGLLPPPPWAALSFVERANMRSYRDARFTLIYDRGTGAFSAVDGEARVALYWMRDVAHLPYYEYAAPMRHLLQGWLQRSGVFVTHAAAVGTPAGGMLLAGHGGAGKSTTALLCLRGGLRYAGDDFVLSTTGPPPRTHSLYSSAKLNADVLAWLPDLRQHVVNPGRLGPEKALVFLDALYPRQVMSGFALKAIALPVVTSQRASRLVPIAPEAAFKAIAPDTAFRALGDVSLMFKAMRALVQDVPSYRLELGADREGLPDVIAAALR